jgi:DNA-binding response OmpR family regulator
MSKKYSALVAEDEPQMASIIAFALETEGFEVVRVSNGIDALSLANETPFDVIVLDVMMPRLDGLEVCRRIRSGSVRSTAPILVVTAKADSDEVIAGLEAGADDYLAKPFHPRELALRAASLARRAHGLSTMTLMTGTSIPAPNALLSSRIRIDVDQFAAFLDDVPLRLTANEFRLLTCLVHHLGSPVTWEQLLREAWGVESWDGGREMVKAAIYRLRQKLDDDPNEPRFIVAMRGVGYRLLPS